MPQEETPQEELQPGEGVGRRPGELERRMREVMRLRHLSYETEKTYWGWVKRYILFHGKRHPEEMGAREIREFLSSLAVEGRVSVSTQKQAMNALVFLYHQVLGREREPFGEIEQGHRQRRLPVVLTKEEVWLLLGEVEESQALMCRLLYGTGMRLMEGVRLRVKDVDFGQGCIIVREGKGGKDRRTVLPQSLEEALRAQVGRSMELHAADLAAGLPGVALPGALEVKYPRAGLEPGWQWVFPAAGPSKDPRTGIVRRHHIVEDGVQRALRRAAE